MSQVVGVERSYENSDLFSGHYLDERIQQRDEWKCDEDASEAFEQIQDLYGSEQGLVEGYNEDALIDNWIVEVLDVLGFGRYVETALPNGNGFVDILLFEDTDARRDAAKTYLDTNATRDLFEGGVGLVEAKRWDADFERRFSEQRPYRNASHQIKHYFEQTPENIQWGILTNGRKWRLYGTKDYETQTYYEIDIPELLERDDLEAFKYFYVFFRPEAFRSTAGTTFLDTVWSESETAAQELGEDLQDNVFTALRILGRGFVETNDLEIDPTDEAELDRLKEQSLVLLYRLMFVLYAESRGLIHPEGRTAIEEFEENFSLDRLRLEIHDEIGEVGQGFGDAYSDYSTTMWSRLKDLFRLIDEGEESLGIPPYNGGLFDRDHHEFLASHEVSNRYLAEVIYRISTTENDEGRYVLADYCDLDTRHLGSVYEGLLEHQFRTAPEQYAAVAEDGGQVWKPATEVSVADAVETVPEGGLYVVNDEGERKATGAYYTPDYVVTYIVEETVEPLIDDIREDLCEQGFEPGTHEYLGAFYRRVKELKILDPAMGSGHFLTRATGYLSRQVMDEVLEIEEATAFDEQKVRRDIAKECIYGVDLNGMAVELAKLSMWLETLAADQPLAFLDHHLKTGNSLVGSDVMEVLSNGDDGETETGQLTFEQVFGRVRQDTLDHVMDRMQELLEIDNETLADVKSMEKIYDDIRGDAFYQRLFELTNVHTAERFDLDVPENAYERMARAIDSEDEWAEIRDQDWFRSAQALSEGQSFFHWELEYPEVFFHVNGEKQEDSGFDAVIGNPPYRALAHGRRQKAADESIQSYLRENYPEASEYNQNLYTIFIDKSLQLLQEDKASGLVVPSTLLTNYYFKKIRDKLLSKFEIKSVVNSRIRVFEDVETGGVTIPIIKRKKPDEHSKVAIHILDENKEFTRFDEVPQSTFNELPYQKILLEPSKLDLLSKLQIADSTVGDESTMYAGIVSGDNEKFLSKEGDDPKHEKVVRGRDIHRYLIRWNSLYIYFDEDKLYSNTNREMFETAPKILMRQTGDSLIAAVDSEGIYSLKTTHLVIPDNENTYYVCSCLNSRVLNWYYQQIVPERGRTFAEVKAVNIKKLPLHTKSNIEVDSSTHDSGCDGNAAYDYLIELPKKLESLNEEIRSLNLTLLDHFGSYSEGQTLAEIGVTQPPQGVADSILTDTAEDRPNLRVGDVEVSRQSSTMVEVRLTARYKPDPDKKGRDAYTETEPLPALQISDISETEADLIEAFVPVAIEEASGFAGFRETATKTNSLVDRIRALTLPAVEDVRDGLESYLRTKERAEELEAKIERTDQQINEIVYDLYGLTDEEIEIVEEAVDD